MPFKPISLFLLAALGACNTGTPAANGNNSVTNMNKGIGSKAAIVGDILLPSGYHRIPLRSNHFGTYLRNISLNEDATVYLYNGEKKLNQQAQYAVLDISVGNTNLQQCADAVMRLRAEFLFEQKRFNEIKFTDNAQTLYAFEPPFTRKNLNIFLRKVFGMCGTASLAKQLKRKSIDAITSGDVLIRGGFPGHAVLVMDVATNHDGKKIFLLAQSYMPAQQIHILKNPQNEKTPWYLLNDAEIIMTPEYHFKNTELKGWE